MAVPCGGPFHQALEWCWSPELVEGGVGVERLSGERCCRLSLSKAVLGRNAGE
ncbi:MAG: hypothetical protein AAGF95_02795 [Chloroflexota bacterium]